MPTLLDEGDLILVKMCHVVGLILTPVVFRREWQLTLTGVVEIGEDGFGTGVDGVDNRHFYKTHLSLTVSSSKSSPFSL